MPPTPPAIVDVNVYVSRWPFRRLAGDEPKKLVAKLRNRQVIQAWTGSFDGLLHRDIAGVNQRLAETCHTHGDGLLLPFGTVNPCLPDWEEDLRRCREAHGMRGIRLHPNYHGYDLTDRRFAKLLQLADEHGLIVQIAQTMEDERTQHPLLRVPHVDATPLPELLRSFPRLPVVLLNAFRSQTIDQATELAAEALLYFDLAMLEGIGGVEKLAQKMPIERILFGSLFPLFYFESATGKLRESAAGGRVVQAICRDNAQRLIGV